MRILNFWREIARSDKAAKVTETPLDLRRALGFLGGFGEGISLEACVSLCPFSLYNWLSQLKIFLELEVVSGHAFPIVEKEIPKAMDVVRSGF